MLLDIIRWLRGYVVFKAVGRFPERFINLCIHKGYFIFDAVPVRDKDKLFASMLLCDYKSIRPLARRCKVRVKVTERHGFPFLISRYKNRKGLLCGAVAFLFIIVFMQNFVWTVEVRGLETISTSSIVEKLKENGVHVGAFKGSRNLHAAERSIMEETEGISWMSINLIGTKAEVEIKEKERKPDIIESDVPCNIKAKTDGLIVSMDIKQGSTELPIGSAVKKGQLIVSGVVKNTVEEEERISLVHADAKVMAKTQYTHNFIVEKTYSGKSPSKMSVRKNIDLFGFSIPFVFDNVSGEYTSYFHQYRLKLNDTCIPVGVTRETCFSYRETKIDVDPKNAEEIFKREEALYRLFALQNSQEIKVSPKPVKINANYSFEVVYDCLEDIALSENIIVN